MLNKLPDELLISILQKVNSPLGEFIQLKNVNRAFNKLVLTVTKKHTVSTSELSNICNKNYLCLRLILYFGMIYLSFDYMSHILILIKNNRLDVLKRGIFYQKFLSQMMNPFYLGKCNQKSDVLIWQQSIMYSCYERKDIYIKFFDRLRWSSRESAS